MHVMPAALAVAEQRGARCTTASCRRWSSATKSARASAPRHGCAPPCTRTAPGARSARRPPAHAWPAWTRTAMREAINIGASMTTATSKRTMLEGGLVRNVYTGLANRNGVLALQLLESGFSGERDGVASLMGAIVSEQFDPQEMLRDLGDLLAPDAQLLQAALLLPFQPWHAGRHRPDRAHEAPCLNPTDRRPIDVRQLPLRRRTRQPDAPQHAGGQVLGAVRGGHASGQRQQRAGQFQLERGARPTCAGTGAPGDGARRPVDDRDACRWSARRGSPSRCAMASTLQRRSRREPRRRCPALQPRRAARQVHGPDRPRLAARPSAQVLEATLALADCKLGFADWVGLLRHPPRGTRSAAP